MTSHLESCKDQAAERMKQLKVVLQNITQEPDNMTVIFGGDTNLRDSEVTLGAEQDVICPFFFPIYFW